MSCCVKRNERQVKLILHWQSLKLTKFVLFYITPRGLKEGATWTMRGGGKRGDLKQSSGIAATFRANVIKAVNATLNDSTPLILCGPGHARDLLLQDLKAEGHSRFIKSIATSMAGRAGANELIRDGACWRTPQ